MKKPFNNISTYISDINNNVGELKFLTSNITVEHRSNNPKRDFLFVNKVQGKHIPCRPSETNRMCKALAALINKSIVNEKVLVIGFCETATAIANIVADNLSTDAYVLQTTRESIGDVGKQLLTFEEEHSHATTQNLMTYADKDEALDFSDYTYALFIDDEISTGRTVLNFIKAFKQSSTAKLKFGVASICNWQDNENMRKFKAEGIEVFSLLSGKLVDEKVKMFPDCETPISLDRVHDYFNIDVDSIKQNPRVMMEGVTGLSGHGEQHEIGLFEYERLGHNAHSSTNTMINLFKSFNRGILHRVRVIGTEEFMYWPIKIAEMFESYGFDVKVQNTTRSSIDVLDMGMGCITSKYIVPSVYDDDRMTYVYNLDNLKVGDYVLFITDRKLSEKANAAYTKLLNYTVGEGNYNIITLIS